MSHVHIWACTECGEVKDTNEYGNKDINSIINTFKNCFGVSRTSRYDRFAAQRLSKKFTTEAVVEAIQELEKNKEEKYVPVVNSVSQLEQKWLSVQHFIKVLEPENVEIDL